MGRSVIFFMQKKVHGVPRYIDLLKMMPGETLCKFLQIFPPRDLVYIEKKMSAHILINF